MLDAIAGLSGLAAGLLAPTAIRPAQSPALTEGSDRTRAEDADRFEYGDHHTHEGDGACEFCRAKLEAESSGSTASPEMSGAAASGESHEATEASRNLQVEQLEPEEQEQVKELEKRDAEVRTHERAHQSAGGAHAGGASYTYQRGPDGKQYAIGGEVSIDISPVDGDPAATIAKMQQVQRAALAPATPSGQDRRVAAQAAQLERQARSELMDQRQTPASEPDSPEPGRFLDLVA